MNKVNITFETITPLWTGDAWQKNVKIRPSSITGSLRFWFEIFCYFSDIEVKSYEEELNYEQFIKSVGKHIKNGKSPEEAEDQALCDLGISLPSRIFGCKGWGGRMKIKKIKEITQVNFQDKLVKLPAVISLNKQSGEWKDFKTIGNFNKKIKEKGKENYKKNYSSWFLKNKEIFYGKFQVTFEVDDVIKDSVLFFLLKFIEKYGFLGGKWNIGYGRIKINEPDLNKNYDEFKLSNFYKKNNERFENKDITSIVVDDKKEKVDSDDGKGFNDSKNNELLSFFLNIDNFNCGNEENFDEKTSTIPKEIRIFEFDDLNFEKFEEILKKLLKEKAKIRNCLRPYGNVDDKNKWDDFRHKFLGTTKKFTEGTKILPLIYKENEKWKGKLMSIAGIINFKEESNGER